MGVWSGCQPRLFHVCPCGTVQLGPVQVRSPHRDGRRESTDAPWPRAVRDLGWEVGVSPGERGLFLFSSSNASVRSPCPPPCLSPRHLLLRGARGRGKGVISAPPAAESVLFLCPSGSRIFKPYLPSVLRVARLRGATGLPPTASENLSLSFFPSFPPPSLFLALPFPPPRALPPSLPSPSLWAGPCSGYTASSAPSAASASARMTS